MDSGIYKLRLTIAKDRMTKNIKALGRLVDITEFRANPNGLPHHVFVQYEMLFLTEEMVRVTDKILSELRKKGIPPHSDT